MKTKIALFVLLFNFVSIASHAADNGTSNGLGVGGAVFNTWGFTYRHHFENNLGIASSLGGWFNSTGGHLGNSIGLLYTLGHHHFTTSRLPESSLRVYLVAYLGNIYKYSSTKEYITKDNTTPESTEHSLNSGLGAGPGLEYFFTPNLAINFDIPWMTFFELKNQKIAFKDSYLHPGGGFTYYF